jgi:tetratricopeptide (TPR) repeat protein
MCGIATGQSCSMLAVLLGTCLVSGMCAEAHAQYQSAEEAWRVGMGFYSSRNYAASREPFEAALKLAPDDAFRLKVYEVLLQAYRQLPEIDEYVEASEFIMAHSPSAAKKTLTRRALMSFVHQRGKTDVLAKRYEDALKKNENDRTALFALSELYERLKRDPKRAAELSERLLKLEGKDDAPVDVLASGRLARQFVQAKKFREGAELYEKIAPLDETLAAWHWKEAASAWLQADEKSKALAAAKKSSEQPPESRSDQLAHFWHRNLADVFLATGEPKLAIPHYEKAIQTTNIQGYIDGCKKSLAEAREQAGIRAEGGDL